LCATLWNGGGHGKNTDQGFKNIEKKKNWVRTENRHGGPGRISNSIRKEKKDCREHLVVSKVKIGGGKIRSRKVPAAAEEKKRKTSN